MAPQSGVPPAMLKVEHIGIAVHALEKAIPLYSRLLDTPCYKQEAVAGEQVQTAFFQQGETKIELLEATGEASAIRRFLDKHGEGVHHIAFAVTDILAEMERLRREGFTLLNETPKRGADNKLICFIHPKDSHGVLIELCQDID